MVMERRSAAFDKCPAPFMLGWFLGGVLERILFFAVVAVLAGILFLIGIATVARPWDAGLVVVGVLLGLFGPSLLRAIKGGRIPHFLGHHHI